MLLAVAIFAAPMRRVLLPEATYGATGGRCLDGSMALYYYGEAVNASSTTWVIELEGGGECHTQADCASRAKTKLGSSKDYKSTMDRGPEFADGGHRVFVPYVSGDAHTGTRTTSISISGPEKFYFSGHLNLASIVDHLNATVPAFADATRVLLTGCSAGGVGTYGNVDWLASVLPHARVQGAPIAGLFFSVNASDSPEWAPPSDWPHWSKNESAGPGRTAELSQLWQGLLHKECAAAQPAGAEFRCGSAGVLYPYLRSPMFILENQFDSYQLFTSMQLPQKKTALEGEYVDYFGKAMRSTLGQVALKPGDGVFGASCLDHCSGLFYVGTPSTTIADASGRKLNSAQALAEWWDGERRFLLEPRSARGLPSNPSCDVIPRAEPIESRGLYG